MIYTTLSSPCFLGNLRGWEILIIFLAILLLFGGKKIPELMKGLGKGVHSFRKGVQEAREEMNRPLENTTGDNASPDKMNTASKSTDETASTGKDRG